MFLKTWRFITLTLVALYMGLEFSHTLELPPKIQYDGSLYVTIQNTLYAYFGMPGPGAFVTVGALLSAIVLVFLVRKRRPAFQWTLAGTIFLALAFPVVYFSFIESVNRVVEQATPQSLPPNWVALRNQWEYAHATNFGLTLISFSALLISILVDTPVKHSRELTSQRKLSHHS
ncbi:hypothetical protein WA1_00565 [Scytonema hofmannii PCC 7110]|uniref:DUF1772 domain-containing protein n=1 Tax=Scytonema hofmannii PCC 7110 TaxID=128403 RepID=A0A139XG72_9CYAN|nr:hypothetical protein [Scytonema hofmannii]KYC43696.1 hypothetical protein WA1_00565 [Scytonema hofmannii PCC 7110]